MSYRWKPSKSQRRAFAEKMKDPKEAVAYQQRKEDRAAKRRSTSNFDYNTAGGEFVPTKIQYDFTMSYTGKTTEEQQNAFKMVQLGYSCKEKIHHDFIHIVNELIRTNPTF